MSIQDPSDYKTGDAVPSNKAMDLNDNAKVFDVFQNAQVPFVKSRLGVDIPTIHGVISGFNQQINSQFIYKNGGNWSEAPDQITEVNKLTYWIYPDDSGNGYAVKGSVTLPITKPATPVNDNNWFLATSVNKQDLENYAEIKSYKSLQDAIATLQSKTLSEGSKVQWMGYYNQSDGGSGWGVVKYGDVPGDGGSKIRINSNIYIDQVFGSSINVLKFGAIRDNATKNSQVFLAADELGLQLKIPSGEFLINSVELSKSAGLKMLKTSSLKVSDAETIKITSDNFHMEGGTVDLTDMHNQSVGVIAECQSPSFERVRFVGGGGHLANLQFDNCRDVKVEKCFFSNASYMLYLRTVRGAYIYKNKFTGGNIQAISNATKTALTNTPVGDAIKCTSVNQEDDITNACSEIEIIGNFFDGVYRDAVDTFTGANQVIISNNIFKNMLSTVLDIKVYYRTQDLQFGTSVENIRQSECMLISNNIFTNIQNVYNDTTSVISVVHYNDLEHGGVPVQGKGVKYININNNIFDNIFGMILLSKDCDNVRFHHNQGFDLQTGGVKIKAQTKTFNNDVDDNKLYFRNGRNTTVGLDVWGLHRNSEKHANGSFNRNELKVMSGTSANTCIITTGTHCYTNGNQIEGFSSSIELGGSYNEARHNTVIGGQRGIVVGELYDNIVTPIITNNIFRGTSKCVKLVSDKITGIVYTENSAIDSSQGFDTYTGSNKIERNNEKI